MKSMSIKLVAGRGDLTLCFEIAHNPRGDLIWTDDRYLSQTFPNHRLWRILVLWYICWICCAILESILQSFHSMLEWEDLQIGILWPATYSACGSVTVPAKHTSTMYIKRLTRQALYREVRISQARCSIDGELCKANFAGCCDVLFVSIFITLVT